MNRRSRLRLSTTVISAASALILGACAGTPPEESGSDNLPIISLVEEPAFPLEAHLESADITSGRYDFEALFEAGSELFHTPYNGLDGVGFAKRPNGNVVRRFSTPGPGGPGSQTCGECHSFPFPSAAGLAHSNIAQDPDNDGLPPFNVRQTPSVLGNGLLQLLAQEITEDLQAVRDQAEVEAIRSPGETIQSTLTSKGVNYGTLTTRADDAGEVVTDTSDVIGVDADLVVKPLAWKGDVVTVRNITAGPAFGGLGMQPEELVWRNDDGSGDDDPDGDGVVRELSVGDITAMTVYTAGQEVPQDVVRLAELGYVTMPSTADRELITSGSAAFEAIGCASCHRSSLHLENTIFEEPTLRGNGHYYSEKLVERDPDYDPNRPFSFDFLTDTQAPRVEAHPEGGAIVRLYGDLKRHRMGHTLADPAPETASDDDELLPIPVDTFLTAELWGVGNTGPWLHDGRAGTLDEAIRLHGEDTPPERLEDGRSEAQEARDAFIALSQAEQRAIIAFLRNLVLFSPNEID